ncbi:hypothetical protein BGZ60DRAFT_400918 [Tricladium varicosporioides]|nr:hypothetical protein BGZ60DRAFT_400918 [Hymenoscyphus varicosporioides]
MSTSIHPTRSISTENKINLIFGIFAVTTGILGCLLAWATWKLAYGRRERRDDTQSDPQFEELSQLQPQWSFQAGQGYEVTFRIGRKP